MILSKKNALSSFGLRKPLPHSTIAMSRSLLNDTIVRLGCIEPPVSWKEGPDVNSLLVPPFNVKNHCVTVGVPWKLTWQNTETFAAFSGAGNTTVPPFSTNGSVNSPATCCLSSKTVTKRTKAGRVGTMASSLVNQPIDAWEEGLVYVGMSHSSVATYRFS